MATTKRRNKAMTKEEEKRKVTRCKKCGKELNDKNRGFEYEYLCQDYEDDEFEEDDGILFL
jgi:ssDNA-binding Zn-finger/Zn-ribbon topoisomerase 1